jgi:hypothetical protein
LSLATPVK